MFKSVQKVSEEDIVKYRQYICEKIKDARLMKRLNQEQLADMIGVKRTHISRIESGKYNFTVDNLLLIMKALDINVIKLDDNNVVNVNDFQCTSSDIIEDKINLMTRIKSLKKKSQSNVI